VVVVTPVEEGRKAAKDQADGATAAAEKAALAQAQAAQTTTGLPMWSSGAPLAPT